jgi:hypothetical protein
MFEINRSSDYLIGTELNHWKMTALRWQYVDYYLPIY